MLMTEQNHYTISPNCAYLATYAEDIDSTCGNPDGNGDFTTCGQLFDYDGYNVIVRHDNC